MASKLIAALAIVGMLLAGCGGTVERKIFETSEKTVVVAPPEALYVCPDVPAVPDGKLTQKDVAVLLINLYQMGLTCKAALRSVHGYIDTMKKIYEDAPAKKTTRHE